MYIHFQFLIVIFSFLAILGVMETKRQTARVKLFNRSQPHSIGGEGGRVTHKRKKTEKKNRDNLGFLHSSPAAFSAWWHCHCDVIPSHFIHCPSHLHSRHIGLTSCSHTGTKCITASHPKNPQTQRQASGESSHPSVRACHHGVTHQDAFA